MSAEVVAYKPYEDRTPSTQYRDLLERVYTEGIERGVIQGEAAKTILGTQIRYDMSEGFPLITERDLSKNMFRGALAEHIAFLNGARTLEQLDEMGVPRVFWERWVTAEKCADFGLEPGDLGDGSYGAAWAAFPTAEGEPFDQIDHVVQQIKEKPFLRTHRITTWIPQYAIGHEGHERKVVVAPCHGDIHVMVVPETKEFSIHHYQRSADMPVGAPLNMAQYAAFGLMLGQQLDGYTFKEIIYTFSDTHIYEREYEAVEEMLNREPRRLGTVALEAANDGVQSIKDYRPGDFVLTDYHPHPGMKIDTPV